MKKLNKPYLNDIIECIEKIVIYTSKISFNQFEVDIKTQDAVFRNIEVIGEATRKLSAEFVEKYPELETHKVTGMRNRLIHGYSDIDLKIVWDVAKNDLPLLKKQVKKILAK